MSADPRHTLGRAGEDLAAAHLERLGYTIVARNVRTGRGELDLVAYDGAALVFVEVKTRRAGAWGPLEALHPGKRRQVRRIASLWLAGVRDRIFAAEVRFDAVAVVIDARGRLVALDHLENAF